MRSLSAVLSIVTGLSTSSTLFVRDAAADNFTAGTVMEKMASAERYAFVSGIIEGLAISRYMQDGKKPDGMNCIYDWYYKNPKTIENIYAAFQHYPDYPPGTVVDVMVRKTCT